MTRQDPLAGFRQRFYIPENTIYVDGNSPGLLSKNADIIRIAPVALYNTFEEAWKVATTLKSILDSKEYKKFGQQR